MHRWLYVPLIVIELLAGNLACAAFGKIVNTKGIAASGVTFTIPKGWSVDRVLFRIVLRPPESDTAIGIIDVEDAADALTAATAAWALYRRDANHQVTLTTPRSSRNGWDEQVRLEYEHLPSEHTDIFAIAYRRGTHWTVAIQEGSEGTVEKRQSAINLIFESLRPPGYQRESFAGRKPHPLDADRIATLKAFVQTSMGELGIPGSAIAFVDHGKVVFEGGLGLRELGNPAPVDAHTLFMIASNTKGLSTLLLAEFVDEGKITRDVPVTQVYPAFRLGERRNDAQSADQASRMRLHRASP
jgi:hypothetical protein